MHKIDTPSARLYNIAEYFFEDEASEHISLVKEAIVHMFPEDNDIHEAFSRYLDGKKLFFSSGICESLTAGYGELNESGYWEFPLPLDFVDQFYGVH